MQRTLSVSEFIAVVNQLVGGEPVLVEGEISEFKLSHKKWVFFKLKDQEQEAVVECFMMAHQLAQPLEDGLLVRVTGRAGVHLRSGRFRITVYAIEPVGEGALARALALLKAKLEKEGLFAEERKRPLPYVPEVIGLIASRESAAYSDFLKVLRARFGGLTILTRHVQVEGVAAIADIWQAFNEMAKAKPRPEVIVLTRGGGSLESLAAFNSEPVARAIFASPMPVVVGVGHERDFTLADLVADGRASTPSNAAELLVPERSALQKKLADDMRQIEASLGRLLSEEAFLLERFNLAGEVFGRAVGERLKAFWARVELGLKAVFRSAAQQIADAERLMGSFNPKAVLKRGYSIVYTKADRVLIRRARQVQAGEELEITVSDGRIKAEVM